jgi:hypothetical protein
LIDQKNESTATKKIPKVKKEKSKKIKISKVVALKVKTKAPRKKVPNNQNPNKTVKKRVSKKVSSKVPNIFDEDSIVIKEEPLFTIGEDCITCSYCNFTTFDLDVLSEHVNQVHSTFEEMEVKPDIN